MNVDLADQCVLLWLVSVCSVLMESTKTDGCMAAVQWSEVVSHHRVLL